MLTISKLIEFYICFLNLFCGDFIIAKVKYFIYFIISIVCFFYTIHYLIVLKKNVNSFCICFIYFMIETMVSALYMLSEYGFNDILKAYMRIWLLVPILIYIYINKKVDIIGSIIKYSILINSITAIQIVNNFDKFGRISSVFSHPNFYAFYLLIVIISIVYYMKLKKIKKYIGLIYIFFNIFMIIAAGSKTSLIVLMAIILYLYENYIHKKNLIGKILITTLIIVIIIIIFSNVKNSLLDLRIFNVNYGVKDYQVNSFEWRILNWKLKFSTWKESLFGIMFGYGIGSEVLYEYKGFAMHNEYLRLLFDCGIIGCLIIVKLLLLVVDRVKKIKCKDMRVFSTCIFIIIFIGAFSENLFVATETTAILLALIFQINRIIYQEE